MAKQKVWKEWTVRFKECEVSRDADGIVTIESSVSDGCPSCLTPTEARRLFQKLSGDYKD